MPQNRHWTLFGLMLSCTLIDQGSKWLAKTQLDPAHALPVIPDVFQFSLSYNTGAAFSMFRQQPHLLAAFTTVLFFALLAYGIRKQYRLRGELTAMGLILGGALGNLLDRLLQGRVTDFFDVTAIHYPIFNVADSFIFIGVFWLLILYLRQPDGNLLADIEAKPESCAKPESSATLAPHHDARPCSH
jgi:signal peptidase II